MMNFDHFFYVDQCSTMSKVGLQGICFSFHILKAGKYVTPLKIDSGKLKMEKEKETIFSSQKFIL